MMPGLGFVGRTASGLRASFEHDVDVALARGAAGGLVTDAGLQHLPAPVQRYLRMAGVVGQPRVHSFRVRLHGRIRSGPDARWMPLRSEQYNFVDDPARLFYLRASMFGIPVQGYHRYVGQHATMDIRAAGLVPVVRAAGPEMDVSETVTLFNDMCFMAPATLIDRAIAWEAVDLQTARATFANAGHTIRAELQFNDRGELIDFRSDDRYQLSPDGKTSRKVRWSTPVAGYRSFRGVRLFSGGQGTWHEPAGAYAYIELTMDEVRYNLTSRP